MKSVMLSPIFLFREMALSASFSKAELEVRQNTTRLFQQAETKKMLNVNGRPSALHLCPNFPTIFDSN